MPRYIKENVSLLKSIRFALEGIGHAFYAQRNIKIQSIAFLGMICLGLFFKISTTEWAILLCVSGLVICLEMINTALELVVDLSTKEKKMRAKLCKDTAAGAVLLASLLASVCGGLIFYERFANLISGGL